MSMTFNCQLVEWELDKREDTIAKTLKSTTFHYHIPLELDAISVILASIATSPLGSDKSSA